MAQREHFEIGQMIGEFKLIKELEDRKIGSRNRRFMMALCPACDKVSEVRIDQAKSRTVESCGCEFVRKRKEGYRKKWFTKEAKELAMRHKYMMQRCYSKNYKSFHNYGGRGVTVCEEWHNRDSFVSWGLKNGYSSELDLDKDKLGDGTIYSPDTCCFIPRKENLRFRRNSKWQ